MICWDRGGDDEYVGVFSSYEIMRLRTYVTMTFQMLEWRADFSEPVPTAEAQRFSPADQADWVLAIGDEACTLQATDSLRLMEYTMPALGGLVQLAAREEAEAWLTSCRLFVAAIAALADSDGQILGQDAEQMTFWLQEVAAELCAVMAAERLPVPCLDGPTTNEV